MGTIAVVGATGTIGSRIVSAMAAAGEELRAIARRPAAANVIETAVKQGTGHVVMHTAVHAGRGDTGTRILDDTEALPGLRVSAVENFLRGELFAS